MENIKCKNLNHANVAIIGFCMKQNCQNETKYCLECLNTTHYEHLMIDLILNEFKQVYNQLDQELKQISKKIENILEQILKKWIRKLEYRKI
ncbi:unnamed protein product [Paramecium octaurelia]|uniref:Uncharacterized protein n=1 Tax=Paramecium octaurelia TaxID=43137 RepID=A0A8S1VUB8_PAROT|nr:unnamed protein product [Paramecium octaurelia]